MPAKSRANSRFLQLLNQARDQWGRGSQTKIANILKVSPQTVTNWKDGVHSPSDLELDALSRSLGNEKYPSKEEAIIVGERAVHAGQNSVRSLVRRAIDLFTAPIIAYAQGGEGAYPEDLGHAVPRIAVPCKDPNCYVLELEGDSMEPIYVEGDLLVVAPNLQPVNNDLVVLKTVDEEVLFKKLKTPTRGPDDVMQFHSFNPNHPPLHLRADQIYRVSVVHSVIRPLKEKVRAMTISESVNL